MSIKTWPQEERPREKLLQRGADILSDAELLAIFLRTGIKGKNALELAREILNHFGSLQKLFDADYKIFCQFAGMGSAKFASLKAILEMSRRYFFEKAKEEILLSDSKNTQAFLQTKLAHREQEIFACLFLNNKNRILAYEELFFGSIDRAEIYPRETLKAALKHNASAIICAHNHTSGDPNPSAADLLLTKHLTQTLRLLEITLLDHIIVGQHGCLSLAEENLL